MAQDKVFMTREGLAELDRQIDEARKDLNNILGSKGEQTYFIDGHRSNSATIDQETVARARINNLITTRENVVIVESHNTNDFVDIGSTVTLEIHCSTSGDIETCKVELIATSVKDFDHELSVNSPLGQAIFSKLEGAETFYEVNGNRFDVRILKIE